MYIFNTLTGEKERLVPTDNHVGIYVCGVTPYDTTHAGHAFAFLAYDILVRYLRSQGIDVTYVQNVTDIDDDILRKSAEVGAPWDELVRTEVARYREDLQALNALPFDHFPYASEHIPQILEMVASLLASGHAYEANGSVYFSVASDPSFGKLSKLPREQMLPVANERGNKPDDPNKRDPLDFVLWQAQAPGEPAWDSPYGPGRPGWHIECSVMSEAYLGIPIDIHGGGADLIFPHHECEIAQSERSSGREPFVRIWMHAGMVRYQGEKMSKSLGNLVIVRDVLETYSSDALRLYLFSHHYRENWEYQEDELDVAAGLAADLREAIAVPSFGLDEKLDVELMSDRFYAALDDDLDTPAAIAQLREMGQAILEADEEIDVSDAQERLQELSDILGLTLTD
jgi:L-cysteine:1D-myo-inositol 2-amino-2-deoxy-alpha-D-glucopyranoside ligase